MVKNSNRSPFVAVVVINWENAPDTIECLESLYSMKYGNFEVVVVDNGSQDGSPDIIQSRFKEPILIKSDINHGYAEGNNLGIAYAQSLNADYILVLNNDTVVAPTMLGQLVSTAEANSQAGMVGPKMYCFSPADTLFAAGSFIRWSTGGLWHRGLFQRVLEHSPESHPEPVDFIVGCGVLVRREMIDRVGRLDASYYLNFEDVEWAVRARRHGFQVLYDPRAVMWHKVSATLGRASAANTYYMTRNALLFFSRNAPRHLRGLATLRILARTLRTVTAWTVRSEYKNDEFTRKRAANIFAIRDFCLGRFGRMGSDVALACDVGM